MATTKTQIADRLYKRKINRQIAIHIPDLWKYAKILTSNEDRAYTLLSNTLKAAPDSFDIHNVSDVDYQSLSRTMYMEYVRMVTGEDTTPTYLQASKILRDKASLAYIAGIEKYGIEENRI